MGFRRVLIDDPEADYEGGMEFRLTYEGPLHATQRDPLEGQPPRHTGNRHQIRRQFHIQLKRLHETAKPYSGPMFLLTPGAPGSFPPRDTAELAERYALYGFKFVPLVTQELDVICSLDILFLRSGRPGSVVVWPGDIDNRLKTLFDAMRLPEAGENYVQRTPAEDEKEFFCLLEDDKLITKVTVETDDLLQPIGDKTTIDPSDARLVITVKIRPYQLTPYNMRFG